MGLNESNYSREDSIIPEITLTEKEMILEVENYLAGQQIVDVKVLSAEQVKDEENPNFIQIRFQYINTNDEKSDIIVGTLNLKNILDIKKSRDENRTETYRTSHSLSNNLIKKHPFSSDDKVGFPFPNQGKSNKKQQNNFVKNIFSILHNKLNSGK